MSVKVNLLPREVAKRERAGQVRALLALGLLVLVAVLGFLYWQRLGALDDVQAELAGEEQELVALQGELADLAEFGELRARRDAATDLLAIAMGGEVSMAGVLQDLAAVMPPSAEVETLSIAAGGGETITLGDARPAIGTVVMSGRSLQGHAPGLERLLLEFDKIAGFSDVYFGSSTLEEVEGVSAPVVGFEVEVDLGPEVVTGRYLAGLPEGLR